MRILRSHRNEGIKKVFKKFKKTLNQEKLLKGLRKLLEVTQ